MGNKHSDEYAGIIDRLWREYEENSGDKGVAPLIAVEGRLYCAYCGQEQIELEAVECRHCRNKLNFGKLIYNLDCYNSKCVHHDAINGCRKKYCLKRETLYIW